VYFECSEMIRDEGDHIHADDGLERHHSMFYGDESRYRRETILEFVSAYSRRHITEPEGPPSCLSRDTRANYNTRYPRLPPARYSDYHNQFSLEEKTSATRRTPRGFSHRRNRARTSKSASDKRHRYRRGPGLRGQVRLAGDWSPTRGKTGVL
jgi:hypothetical protein